MLAELLIETLLEADIGTTPPGEGVDSTLSNGLNVALFQKLQVFPSCHPSKYSPSSMLAKVRVQK